MKLYIQERLFSWTDTFDVYDENYQAKYFCRNEAFRLAHHLHVYDANEREIGAIHERAFKFLDHLDIEIDGAIVGSITRQPAFFKSSYHVDFMNWTIEGDLFSWNYHIYENERQIMHIYRDAWRFKDFYTLEFDDPADEIYGLLLVLAIDAANCQH